MRDLVEPLETAGPGDAATLGLEGALVNGSGGGEEKFASRSRHALDMVAFGSRKIAKYEALLAQIVGEIGRFAEAAKRERSQLEDEVKALRQELAALRKEHAAAEQTLINSQLDCWALKMRIQAMTDAKTMLDGLPPEKPATVLRQRAAGTPE